MLMRTSQILQQLQQTKQQQTMTAKATPTVSFRRTSRLCLAVLSLAALANLPATAAGRGLRMKSNNAAATANRGLATTHNLQKRDIAMPIPIKDIENIISLEQGKGKGVRGSKKQSYDDDYVESHEKYYELGYEENCEVESHTKKSKGHNHKRRCKPKDYHDPHDKLQRPTASPVMTTTSAPIQVPVPAPTPTAAPNDITLFPTVDTNQPTLIIDESPLDTLEASTIFAATPRANIVQASSSEALRSSGILTSDAPSATPSATPSDVPSFVPSDVPSDVPSSVPSTGPSIDMTVFETVPIIPRVSGSATEQGSVDTVGATSGPSPSPVEFQRVPRIPYPTSGPSPSPTEQEVAIAKSVPQGSTLWLTADPVNLQAVGSVDVNLVRQPFFQHVETLMKPYMMKHVGEILRNFELNIEFLPPKTRSIPVGVTGSQFRTVSFFDVLVKMEISSENVDDLTLFRDEQATAAVTSFFKGMSLGALITSLNQASIRIDTILHAELSMEEHLANLYPVDEGLQVSDPFEKVQGNDPVESAIKPETSKDDKKDKAAALYAALVSGGAVLVAVMLAILYNRRRQRRFKIHYPGDSEEGSLFTDSDVSTIKPAAITLRDKSGDDNSVLSNMSPLYHQSVTRKPGFPIIPPRMSFDPDLGGEEKEELEHASEFVNTGSSALTCLDGAQQVDNLSKNYPEFDMYSSMPPSPSPAWSADGVTIPYSYSVDDEEYQKERKRWHDEADDLALIHIPDQRSVVSNFTMDDANDDEESYQENEI